MSQKTVHLAAELPALAADLVLRERRTPSPGHGEILVRNHAIAANPVDWKRQLWGFAITSFPLVLGSGESNPKRAPVQARTPFQYLGCDIHFLLILCVLRHMRCGGRSRTLGVEFRDWRSCDRVGPILFLSGDDDHAAFQAYTIVKATSASKLPDMLDFASGAALPTAVGTSTVALFDVLGLSPPSIEATARPPQDKPFFVLVWRGASSVGSMAVQMASLAGYSSSLP